MARRDQHIELTRDEFYARVCAESMSKLARQYGLSDRGLAKICDCMGIPTPGRGYIDEQGRVDSLMEPVKAWQLAQQLRDYVKAVSGAGYYAQAAITGGRDLEAWCDRALDQASHLDPTLSSPPSVLDDKDLFLWRR